MQPPGPTRLKQVQAVNSPGTTTTQHSYLIRNTQYAIRNTQYAFHTQYAGAPALNTHPQYALPLHSPLCHSVQVPMAQGL
jgi:hypothetical protein